MVLLLKRRTFKFQRKNKKKMVLMRRVLDNVFETVIFLLKDYKSYRIKSVV